MNHKSWSAFISQIGYTLGISLNFDPWVVPILTPIAGGILLSEFVIHSSFWHQIDSLHAMLVHWP